MMPNISTDWTLAQIPMSDDENIDKDEKIN